VSNFRSKSLYLHHPHDRIPVRYGDELAKLMNKALMIGRVASFARALEHKSVTVRGVGEVGRSILQEGLKEENDEVDRENDVDLTSLHQQSDQSSRINELLGEWEDANEYETSNENATIGAIIQFRQSLTYLTTSYPFSGAFGSARTREECIASSEQLYKKLMMKSPKADVLNFDTLAQVAIAPNGKLDEVLAKNLIHFFRPDRNGNLTLLDFAKSIDECYKELRLLRASVAASSKMGTFSIIKFLSQTSF
jgi:hypothetical protein